MNLSLLLFKPLSGIRWRVVVVVFFLCGISMHSFATPGKNGDVEVDITSPPASQLITSGSNKYLIVSGTQSVVWSATTANWTSTQYTCNWTFNGNSGLKFNGSTTFSGTSTPTVSIAVTDAAATSGTVQVSLTGTVASSGSNKNATCNASGMAFVTVVPVVFEILHAEDGGNLNAITLYRDEIADLKIKVSTVKNEDWNLTLDMDTTSMKTETLGSRGSVQMYDFGRVDAGSVIPLTVNANSTTKNGPYDITLPKSSNGEATFKIVVNKAGSFKLRLKSSDGKIDAVSQEFTVIKRIRKYGRDNANTTYDFNKHDQHFMDAANYWGAFYVHAVDDVERLKAIGMTESELGRSPQSQARQNDIMTIGHPDDHVLDALHYVSGYQEKEVDPQSNDVRWLNYPNATCNAAATAIYWGTCWLYHKAQSVVTNSNPPPPYIPGSWRTWDDAATRYNGGGVPNYLQRVTRAFREGKHPTDNTTLWPILTNKRTRGN